MADDAGGWDRHQAAARARRRFPPSSDSRGEGKGAPHSDRSGVRSTLRPDGAARRPDPPTEDTREVALVGEPGRQGHVGEVGFRLGESPAREPYPKPAHILS
jgi:hypothetical protein